jgi:hypothetical protein
LAHQMAKQATLDATYFTQAYKEGYSLLSTTSSGDEFMGG